MIELTLPYPISANRYWRSYVPRGKSRAMTVLSDEAKAYKRDAAWLARKQGLRQPIDGRVMLTVRLYPKRPQDAAKRAARDPMGWDDSVQCLDLDNSLKVLIDALKGIAFADDRWVWRIDAQRMEPDGDARVVVGIAPVGRACPQPALLGVAA